jgi:hypothetical protein
MSQFLLQRPELHAFEVQRVCRGDPMIAPLATVSLDLTCIVCSQDSKPGTMVKAATPMVVSNR